MASCVGRSEGSDFFTVEDSRFVKGGEPVRFIGTNVWYAADIAVSDRGRLETELDSLKAIGLTNIRVCATEENFEGMDILLSELEERGMAAVLYLNNAWEWSPSGYRSYLEAAGAGKQPHPAVDGYWPYMCAMAEFAANEKAVVLFREHIRRYVERYSRNPAVFAWQICNEPRPFSTDSVKVEAFVNYIQGTAGFIKSLDPNHLVCTGNEGAMGCNDGDYDLCRRLNDCPYIDYITVHIWPFNWGWIKEGEAAADPELVKRKTIEYLDRHLQIAGELGKPVVVEEFGYPRDGQDWRNTAGVEGRDGYYALIFNEVVKSAAEDGLLAGCNFWSWSGVARQTHEIWQEGDDLCGDPSQEAQGLNGVYLLDRSTVDLVWEWTGALAEAMKQHI